MHASNILNIVFKYKLSDNYKPYWNIGTSHQVKFIVLLYFLICLYIFIYSWFMVFCQFSTVQCVDLVAHTCIDSSEVIRHRHGLSCQFEIFFSEEGLYRYEFPSKHCFCGTQQILNGCIIIIICLEVFFNFLLDFIIDSFFF